MRLVETAVNRYRRDWREGEGAHQLRVLVCAAACARHPVCDSTLSYCAGRGVEGGDVGFGGSPSGVVGRLGLGVLGGDQSGGCDGAGDGEWCFTLDVVRASAMYALTRSTESLILVSSSS